ncbi:translation initiation factor if-2, putative, partial [Ixodes scapularis]
ADAGDGTNEDAPNRKAKAKKGAKNADSDDEDARPVTKGKKGKKGKGGGESEEEEEAVKPARKGKKGKKGAESDEEEEPAVKPTKGKKGKKKGAESDEEEEEAPKPPKGKKGRKGAESDEEEEEAPKPLKGKKGRKGAESDEEEEEPAAKPAKGKKGKKKGVESDEEGEAPKLPKGKKGKKKGADSDEEEEASTKKAGGFSLLDLGEEGDEGEESGKEEEPEEEEEKQEQERKERKKQKEKERRERAKAEGRLLTKAQKTARARMEATLKALKEQGDWPRFLLCLGAGASLWKWGNRRAPHCSQEVPQVQLEIRGPEGTPKTESEDPGKEGSPTEVEAHEEDDVKDAWDATSSEEEEEEVSESQTKAEVKSEVKAAPAKKREPAKKAPAKKAESSSESSSSEDSDSEEESSEESSDSEDDKSHSKEKVLQRIQTSNLSRVCKQARTSVPFFLALQKQREEAEKKRSVDHLRSPVICVLGHVDTGKTKILDTIRHTHVQDSEAGGITQQIGATMVPLDAIKEQCKMVKEFTSKPLNIPGLLIIDTPGHESFSNLRSRGSSLCDMAILVVDLMHGLEPQTIESLNMLRSRKTPFVVALNKVDRLYDWKGNRNKDITDVLKSQSRNTKLEFEERTREVVLQFAEQGLNAALFHENQDQRTFISLVPTSALSGDGMGNLISLIVDLTQNMMAKRIAFSEELQATVLEVKAIPGLGTTIDVILVNGYLREGDTMVLAGHDGPFTTPIRSLLMPQPMKELRVKNPYQEYKEVKGAQGVKIAARDLDRAIAGLQVLIAHHPDEVEVLKDEVSRSLKEVMSGFKLSERGVYVQASTLGSLEALLEFLRVSKIPYSGIRIGPVVKKDVMKASIMLEHDTQYAVILAFDVKVERDAQELADSLGVRIFQADIIYHLFDKFMAYREELRQKKRDEFKSVAVFPCKVRILPQFVFNSRDPIVVGVSIEAGVVKEGTPLCVPSKDFLEIGTVTTIEVNHKPIESARKGQEVCLKIEALGGDAPKMYGRHFDHTDFLVSKITRQSIDACKEYFRDDLIKTDWQLMVELKKLFQIL